MREVEVILGLLAAVALLVPIARRIAVPYPVLLVCGGIALALTPGVPRVEFRPELILFIFLPPLLYVECISYSTQDLRKNLRPIASLVFGLILATSGAVAAVAHALVPGLSWPAAFILGTLIAPTDEVALGEVAERLPLPHRVMAILGGESLVNDAVSLVAYKVAVAAAVSGQLSLWHAGGDFVLLSVGGVAAGLLLGLCIIELRKRVQDPLVANTISFLTPYAAYVVGEAVGVSGVLAVVAVGLLVGHRAPEVFSSRTRIQVEAFWRMIAFMLNGLLFLYTGLELRAMLSHPLAVPLQQGVAYAAAAIGTIIVVRMAWVMVGATVPCGFRRHIGAGCDTATRMKEALLIGWTGIRGGISLATALAIPLTISGGQPFPERRLIIFITFCVIVVTIILQGLTVGWLARTLALKGEEGPREEEWTARLEAANAALDMIAGYEPRDGLAPEQIQHMRGHYLERVDRLEHRLRGEKLPRGSTRSEAYREFRRDLVAAERQAILALRDEGKISDATLRRIQHDLDLEELQYDGAE